MATPPNTHAPDRTGLAIAAITLAVCGLSLGDAVVKASSAGGFGLWQIFALRAALVVPLMGICALLLVGRRAVVPQALGWVTLRSALLTANWIAFYAALPHMDFALAAAIYYTLPLFITLFAGLFLGERIGARGWLAVALGFAGVLAILRPGTGALGWASLLPLLAAILYALAMVLTRARCRGEHPIALAFGLQLGCALVGLLGLALMALSGSAASGGFLSQPWAAMGAREWGVIAVMAASTVIGSAGAAYAYQNGPAAVVGVFDFTYLGFALLWGLLIFATLPDAAGWAGIAMIAVAGFMVATGGQAIRPGNAPPPPRSAR